MSSGFCFPGSALLRSVICRKKLHAARLPAAEVLHVKTEFYQKSQPHFLRFFGLTFHNIRRKSRPAGVLPGKRNRVFKELSTFPTDFSTRSEEHTSELQSLAKFPENVNPANGILFFSDCRYAVSIILFPARYAGKTAPRREPGGGTCSLRRAVFFRYLINPLSRMEM